MCAFRPFDVLGLVGMVLMNDREPSSVITSILYSAVVVCMYSFGYLHSIAQITS
jgi:hypothetical protein